MPAPDDTILSSDESGEAAKRAQDQEAKRARAKASVASGVATWARFIASVGAPIDSKVVMDQASMGMPPHGTSAPDPDELLAGLEEGLRRELLGLPKPFEALGGPDEDRPRRSARLLAERDALSKCSWALHVASSVGCFDQALAAFSRVQDLPVAISPHQPRVALLRAALGAHSRADLDECARRAMLLAAEAPLWDPSAAWASAQDPDAFSSMSDRFDEGHYGSMLLRLASMRPAAGKACAELLTRFATASESHDWAHCGESVGERARHHFVKADAIPEAMWDGLPDLFWLGVKFSQAPSSKLGALAFARLLGKAESDASLKKRLCAAVWLSFDRKAIGAFDSRFPGYSPDHMREAIVEHCAGFMCSIAGFRIADHLARPASKWAAKAFEERGLSESELKNTAFDAELAADAACAAAASKEASELRAEVRSAAKAKALAKGGPKAKAAPKPPKRRL